MISKENSLYRKNDLPARGFAKKSSLRTEKFCIAKIRAIFDEKALTFEQKSRWRKIFFCIARFVLRMAREKEKKIKDRRKLQNKYWKIAYRIFLNIKRRASLAAQSLSRFCGEGSSVFLLSYMICEVLVLAQISVQQLMLLAL